MNQEKVFDAIAEFFGIERDDVSRDMSLKKDFNVSSIEITDLFVKLEEVFGVHIDEYDAENIETVGHLTDYIIDHYDEINPNS